MKSATCTVGESGTPVALSGGMRVIGYTRVSTEEQASMGVSLAAQAEKVRGYAKLYDLELVELIEDAGASAKTLDRPGLARALEMLSTGKADGIVVAKLDRLTRSVADMATLIKRHFSEKAGKSLFSVADSIDTRSAAGRMVLNILVSVSQWEREAIGERTRDALRHKRANGQVYGHVPLGFRAEGKTLVADDGERAAVDAVTEMHRAGLSLRSICSTMTSRGFRTKRGGAWRPSTVQSILRRLG